MWKIGKIVSKGDYNYAVVKEHPNATVHGYVLEHRVVMENHLGRLLDSDEVVHHKNGNKKDNRVENLEMLAAKEHKRLHATKGRTMVELVCPQCEKRFCKERRNSFLGKRKVFFSCCSSRCRGLFSRRIQLKGRTAEVEAAISGNVVREFNSLDNREETADNGIRRGHTLPA